jgi:hypothetical protein
MEKVMSKKYIIGISICIAVLAVLGFVYTGRHASYTSHTPSGADIVLDNTTWELVEYTYATTVDNLTGTDWILSFDAHDGVLQLCDKHQFDYFINTNHITFEFKNPDTVNCQHTAQNKESHFIDLLSHNPIIEQVVSPDSRFTQVLTFTHDDEKLIFVQNKQSQPSRNQTKNITFTTDIPYTGTFTITPFNPQTGNRENASSTVTTDTQGVGTVALPVGTYQIMIEHPTANRTMLPIVFSVTDSRIKQTVTLPIKEKK